MCGSFFRAILSGAEIAAPAVAGVHPNRGCVVLGLLFLPFPGVFREQRRASLTVVA
ncbi:protein of unknown function [Methylocaldum szegediense]|uniref:Uncharacterized protein n=1 Tax=Methylocaldum szegediense TaxID=73780 RepID=A0ABN8WXB2_9GAMM|nr:protein of unknown function [Methylocaldum szegediense]